MMSPLLADSSKLLVVGRYTDKQLIPHRAILNAAHILVVQHSLMGLCVDLALVAQYKRMLRYFLLLEVVVQVYLLLQQQHSLLAYILAAILIYWHSSEAVHKRRRRDVIKPMVALELLCDILAISHIERDVNAFSPRCVTTSSSHLGQSEGTRERRPKLLSRVLRHLGTHSISTSYDCLS